jgi:hypothetical protein
MTMAKKYYLYDLINGAYLETGDVAIDVLGTEHYPKNATLTPIPKVEAGKIAVFNIETGVWTNVPDHRNETFYNLEGEEVVIYELGGEKDLYATPPAPTLETVKAKAVIELTLRHTIAIKLDINFTTKAGIVKDYQTGKATLDSLSIALVTNPLPDNFYWVSLDNTKVPFTLEDLQGLYNTIYDRNWALFQKLQDLKQQVRDESNILNVPKIVW